MARVFLPLPDRDFDTTGGPCPGGCSRAPTSSPAAGPPDNTAGIWGHYAPSDPTEPLDHWLRDVLVPGGDHYDADQNFSDEAPGDSYAYSDTGHALLGLVVESVVGEPFDQWCDAHLFAPLGMTDSSWKLAGLPEEGIARPRASAPRPGSTRAPGGASSSSRTAASTPTAGGRPTRASSTG